jgi:hypothetical protein
MAKRSTAEAAATRARDGYYPTRLVTTADRWLLVDGHLTAQCSFDHQGAPACPACLVLVLFQ